MEGKLGPLLTLSWLVRGQLGAKMGKLTLLGGLRGTRLELKGALGGPKKAPREPQRGTGDIDGVITWVILEARGPPKVT